MTFPITEADAPAAHEDGSGGQDCPRCRWLERHLNLRDHVKMRRKQLDQIAFFTRYAASCVRIAP